MEIHKPKAWHGFREFLKEYGIIVLGVLTALAAEQIVEQLRWRYEARRAEADLATGLQPDLINSATWISSEKCFRSWLTPLAKNLQSPEPAWRGTPLELPSRDNTTVMARVFAAPGFVWSHAAWENAETSGVLSHMNPERVERFGEIYRLVDLARERVTLAGQLMDELAPLSVDRRMTEQEKGAYLQKLAHLESIVGAIQGFSRLILQESHQLGIDPPPDKIRERFVGGRVHYGACVTEVKLPLS